MEMAEQAGGLTGCEGEGDEVVDEKARKPASAASECAKPNRAPLTTSDSSLLFSATFTRDTITASHRKWNHQPYLHAAGLE